MVSQTDAVTSTSPGTNMAVTSAGLTTSGSSATAGGSVTGTGGPVTSTGNPAGGTSGGAISTSGATNGVGGATATASTSGGAPGDCGITVDSYELSPTIATVGIVSWSATAAIDSAEISFGPSDTGLTMTAPVDLNEPGYRTLLLGMKSQRDYNFQIVATAAGQTCSSEVLSLSTGYIANALPDIEREVVQAAAVSPGFIVTMLNTSPYALIFDADGDIVWWASGPTTASSARMDWHGKNMWMVTGNPSPSGRGELWRVSMDGSETVKSTGLDVHHDIAPLPNGNVVALVHQDGCSAILELTPELTTARTIVADVSTLYQPSGMGCHPNSVLYHPEDESLTVSDREPNLYVKVSKTGELEWQFGGQNPLGPHISQIWSVNHGHQLLPDNHFLFFNNNGDQPGFGVGTSHAVEFALDLEALTATEVFRYVSDDNLNSASLGDVQRLPNGNTLVTYSNTGVIHEVDAGGALVQVFRTGVTGYAMHRESLYGPPPK
ncbi:MAG TPA: aryl-sulfate sulfotransferase [Polyangiaceae bacterium]